MQPKSTIVDEMIRHLPPSSHNLMLLHVGEDHLWTDAVTQRRPDVQIIAYGQHGTAVIQGVATYLPFATACFDAISARVSATHYMSDVPFYTEALRVLRPGGRLMMAVTGLGDAYGAERLQAFGFVRILGEKLDGSMLIRGEKVYDANLSTMQRVHAGSAHQRGSGQRLVTSHDFHQLRVRYLHMLIWQHPNKPAWRRSESDVLQWVTPQIVSENGDVWLLGFSSLPRAVGFMQKAVLAGYINDINHIAKFIPQVVEAWHMPLLFNPAVEEVMARYQLCVEHKRVDPQVAELADE